MLAISGLAREQAGEYINYVERREQANWSYFLGGLGQEAAPRKRGSLQLVKEKGSATTINQTKNISEDGS